MFDYFWVEFHKATVKEMVEDVVIEEDVEEMDVFAEMGIVFAGFNAFPHHGDEGLELVEGDEF